MHIACVNYLFSFRSWTGIHTLMPSLAPIRIPQRPYTSVGDKSIHFETRTYWNHTLKIVCFSRVNVYKVQRIIYALNFELAHFRTSSIETIYTPNLKGHNTNKVICSKWSLVYKMFSTALGTAHHTLTFRSDVTYDKVCLHSLLTNINIIKILQNRGKFISPGNSEKWRAGIAQSVQ
jgi:hypothetical protein